MPKSIGIESSKEIKFGKPDIPKSDYSNAKTIMRSKSSQKDTSGMFKPKGSSTGKRYKAQGGAFAERVTRDKERAAGVNNSSLTSAGFSKGSSNSKSNSSGGRTTYSDNVTASGNRPTSQTGVSRKVDSKGNQIYGTPDDIKKVEAINKKQSTQSKSNPYADAKKRDPQLDSYIKQRNAAEKGSSAYNEAQNKINRAYGKGPIREVAPISEAKGRGTSTEELKKTQIENKSAPKQTLQTKPKPTPPPPPAPKSKKEQRTDRRVGRIEDRREKREDKAADRSFARSERKGERADNKQSRMDRRDRIRVAKGKNPKQMKYGGTRKAQAGAAIQAGGAVLGGIGKLTDAIAGRETKFGKIAGAVGDTAGAVGGMMGGIPGGIPGGMPGGQTPQAAPPAPNQPQAPQAPQTSAADTSVEQAANQPMRRGGKRKMMGGKKMKYKAGGAKPDYLDMDKDGNKTEPMKSALKDRRSKAKKGRYKAQEGTITPEGARQKRYSYNKTKERQERNMSQARTKRMKEIVKAALTGNVGSMAAMAAKKMKNK